MSEVTTLKVKDCFEDAGYWVLDFLIKGGKRNRLAIHHELQRILLAYLAQSGHRAERGSPLFLAVPRSERRKALGQPASEHAVSSLRARGRTAARGDAATRPGDLHHRGPGSEVSHRGGASQCRRARCGSPRLQGGASGVRSPRLPLNLADRGSGGLAAFGRAAPRSRAPAHATPLARTRGGQAVVKTGPKSAFFQAARDAEEGRDRQEDRLAQTQAYLVSVNQ